MNSVILITKSFLICSFFVLFIRIIAPKGSTEKILSLVLTVFTLFSIISPLKNLKNINFQSIEPNNEYNETKPSESAVLKTEIRILTDEALNSLNIDNYELIINVSEIDNGTVSIDEYKIYVSDISRKEEIQSAVKSKTDLTPEVYEMESEE